MLNSRILREAENASTTHNRIKSLGSEQKLPKLKAKALGDVQNTLHSRPMNAALSTWSPDVKAPSKFSVRAKKNSDANDMSMRSTASKIKVCITPAKLVNKSVLQKLSLDGDMQEIHNHGLCEQEDQSHINDYFREYKFSEEQIKNLVHPVKVFVTPVLSDLCEPCEDIEIPNEKKLKSFSFSDIFNDSSFPQVLPPVIAL